MKVLKDSWYWDARNFVFKALYYQLSNSFYLKAIEGAMLDNTYPRLSNMNGPRDCVYIDGSPILNIECLGATMTTGVFFSSYADNLTVCYTYGDIVVGPHAFLMKDFEKNIHNYIDLL